jgi:hypothetical protein
VAGLILLSSGSIPFGVGSGIAREHMTCSFVVGS